MRQWLVWSLAQEIHWAYGKVWVGDITNGFSGVGTESIFFIACLQGRTSLAGNGWPNPAKLDPVQYPLRVNKCLNEII